MNKLRKPLILLSLLMVMVAVTNCTYKNAEDAYPINLNGCATANMSYANDIKPILVANCYSCHDSITSYNGKGYRLDTWAFVEAQVNPQSGDVLYGNLVAPVGNLTHMPNNGNSLSACEIAKIKAWIDQGYLNN